MFESESIKIGEELVTVNEKISKIREKMITGNIDAFVVPSSDPHMAEYLPSRWKTRAYVSGFTGSAGTFIVTKEGSGLWVDGRYYAQAEKEIKGTEIELFYGANPDCPTFYKYLSDTLSAGSTVGFDGMSISSSLVENMEKDFKPKSIKINSTLDYANDIWGSRQSPNYTDVFYLDKKFSGESAKNKIDRLKKEIAVFNADSIVLGALDNISWLFNIRANDIHCNPFVTSYAFISKEKSILFIDDSRISEEVLSIIHKNGVELMGYEEVFSYMECLSDLKVFCDKDEVNYSLFKTIKSNKNISVVAETNPILLMKACKSKKEIENTHLAHLKDACANAEFYAWLFEALENGETLTEFDLVLKVAHYRSLQENYFDESFDAILAYKDNAAMMHYKPIKDKSRKLERSHLLLNDSGGQYFYGTTDTTRTFALGDITKEERHDFTIVLKGLIALSRAIFKYGCTGSDIDVLSRQFFWSEGIDYRCGTGHGVGFMLGVHENPPSFKDRNIKFRLGMTITIEPGVYTALSHGVRLENTVVVVPHITTEYGEFYRFETFTLVPIDTTCIDKLLLTKEEVYWINCYHKLVFKKVSPLVSDSAKKWLALKTKSI